MVEAPDKVLILISVVQGYNTNSILKNLVSALTKRANDANFISFVLFTSTCRSYVF